MSIEANGTRRARSAGPAVLDWIERKLGITPVGLIVLGVAAAGWLAARALGSRHMFLLVYGLLSVVGISWLIGRRNLAAEARRSELPTRVREGQIVDAEIAVTAKRRLSTIVLEEGLHPQLGTDVHVPVPLLPSGEEVTHLYSFTPRLRGVYDVGPLIATWSDPFGLTRRRMTLLEPAEIIVHPSTEQASDRVLSREWEDPPIRPPFSKPWPTGFEFYGMRDYVSGDDPRRIVWRATAKLQDPDDPMNDRYLVRESEQGITDRVGLVLDTDMATHSPGEPSETFETGVRVVASLGTRHVKDGFAVSVTTNGRKIAEQLRGEWSRIKLLDELARVRREPEPFSRCMDRLLADPRRDTHLVVVTPHIEPDAATRLRMLVERGVSILLVHLMWDDTDPASVHRAGLLGSNVVEVWPSTPLGGVFQKVLMGGIRR